MSAFSRRTLFSALLVLPAACAELATPRGPLAPPAGLLNDAPDPGRAAITALDDAFRDGGIALRRSPAAAARAAAILEWLASDLQSNPRWAPVAPNLRERVVLAREEMRVALGLMTGIPAQDASRALAGASVALDRGDRRAAAALGDGRFRHGGERALERLADPGPLPGGEIALGLLAQEVARLDRNNGWVVQPALDPSYEGTRVLRQGV